MVIIRMTGGLGNQMFQYALYLKLKSMGREVKFDDFTEYALPGARPIQLWTFGLTYPVATQEELNKITDGFLGLSHKIRRKLFGRRSLEYHENSCNFDQQILEKDPAYLVGYFQSEKYFRDIESRVREAFVFQSVISEKLDKELQNRLEEYRREMEGEQSVSLHIRRGDYLENEEVFGESCTSAYYESAITQIKKRIITPVFYVFSNDEEWAEKWCEEQELLYGCPFKIVKGFPEEKGYLDMDLMSRCRYHIIANSSFSWWGAWLDNREDKVVVAPAKWFNNKTCYDIYTKGMIKISPEGIVE